MVKVLSEKERIILGAIAAYGPVTVAQIQHYAGCQMVLAGSLYELNGLITGILNSDLVDVYDLAGNYLTDCLDGPGFVATDKGLAVWGA